MQLTRLRVLLIALALGSSVFTLVSCGGDTGGEGDSFDGSSYNDDESGDIRVVLNEDRLAVGSTTGFRVRVNNASGAGVSNLQIACDTETGLALLEPTSGFEMTDSEGQMSGRVGCVTPGSYQIGCRLPVGANLRNFQTVICEGPVPAGFNGFPGSGGGSLGTGTGSGGAVPPANNGNALITAVTTSENSAETNSIDVQQDICGTADNNGDGDTTDPQDIEYELFTDTTVGFSVKNETAETINFSSFSYKVSGASGSGTSFSSNELAFLSGGSVAPGATANLKALFLKAISPGRKSFTGSSSAISTSTGFRNVTFTLSGTSSAGESFETSATVGLSFGNYNKCS